jgi:hypothetical protein
MKHCDRSAQNWNCGASQSVQTLNANSSSLNNIFKVVIVAFKQIMTEHNASKSEDGRIVVITTVLKVMKQNGC